jgi:hypothetical protein
MVADPTVKDFQDRIDWHLGKARNRAAEAASNILRRGSRGMAEWEPHSALHMAGSSEGVRLGD